MHVPTPVPVCSVAVLLLAGRALAQSAEYDELTNTYRSTTQFNVETTRGLGITSQNHVLLLNTHGSTLNLYIPGGPFEPDYYWPTLNNPIAVAPWMGAQAEYALVLGGASHALALHDLATGRIVDLVQLPAEPGDLVVDQDNARAFVSCPGNNTVHQIGLPELDVQAVFNVASQRPRALFLDRGDPQDVADNLVFVAPELSGNNSVPIDAPQARALDLNPFLPQGLPDEDLFRIQPVRAPSGNLLGFGAAPVQRRALPVLRNAGTLLMAHGRNPVTGDYWLVGVDALNTLPGEFESEPSLKGRFARNQLTIATRLGAGEAPVPFGAERIDLDMVGSGYDARFTVGFPYDLAFHPSGSGLVVGSTTDRVRWLDAAGARIGDLDLPDGSIPRDLHFDASGQAFLVHCWGTNEARGYSVDAVLQAMAADADGVADPDAGLLLVLPLGADPATPGERRGREHFYDGDNSLHARTSCNHCHAGGGMDLIGWNISDFPHDHKALMVTQSLKSIEDTFPYHWRGERDLEAFNGAFAGLLGGSALDTGPGGEFDDFKAFVFSLQAHANPVQDPRRQLDPARSRLQAASDPPPGHTVGDPITGQPLMDLPETFIQRFSCADCHGKVAGTVGDPVADGAGGIPANIHMDTSHFRHLFHKNQDLVDASVTLADGSLLPIDVPRGGYGLSHDGNHPSTFDFIDVGAFKLNDVEARDLAAFIEQADHGISPAVHLAFHVDQDTPKKILGRIESLLLDQVAYNLGPAHWVDVALIGTHQNAQGVDVDLRWAYDHGTKLFRTDSPVTLPDGSVSVQSWSTLKVEVAAQRATFTVLGLPPHNAHRFSLDSDDDGLENYAERLLGTDPFDPDTDGDGDPDGHEAEHGGTHLDPGAQANDTTPPSFVWGRVDHVGASFAKLIVKFSEPVALKVTATETASGHTAVEQRFVFRQVDTITVPRLAASMPAIDYPDGYPVPDVLGMVNQYALDLEMTDLSGNVANFTVGNALETRDLLVPNPFDLTDTGGVPDLAPAMLTRIVTELSWSGSPQGGTVFRGRARVAHRFDVPELLAAYANPPNTPNGSNAPNERQVLLAQVLHFDAVQGSWSVLPTSGVGPTVSAPPGRLQATISLQGDPKDAGDPPPPPADLPIEGPFLLSSVSNSTGGVEFEFTLSQPLGVDDRVSLNVVAILEQDVRDAPVPANEFWRNSSFSYSKPATDQTRRSIRWPN